jgi:cardiolipin hydrolase
MTPQEIEAWLVRTLDDRSLSRSERQTLAESVNALGPSADRQSIRHRAFEVARSALSNPDDQAVLDWLEGVVKVLQENPPPTDRTLAEAYFSPGDECRMAIARLLYQARRSAEVCVFTITDDRLSGSLLEAHRRGVSVRIITDDSKADDLGSDIARLGEAGIPVLVDHSPYHMHHKFAVLDGHTLLTGSYNWTRGAASDNEENLIVSNDHRFTKLFSATFERVWANLSKGHHPGASR